MPEAGRTPGQAASELNLVFQFEKVKDLRQIMAFGVMVTPALVVDGVVKVAGKVPGVEEIKKCWRNIKERKMKNTIARHNFILVRGIIVRELQAANTKADEKKKCAAVENYLVTFVELGSVRCIPCKMMQPIMKDIEKDYAGQVKVVFHDVWTPEGEPFATSFKIRVIPTQVFLDKDGKEYFRHEGFFPKEELIKVLQQKGVK